MSGVRTRFRLTALFVDRSRRPGVYADGGGLSLVVTSTGVKRWELRVTERGRRRQLGLGLLSDVSLNEARRRAAEIRAAIRDGREVEGHRPFDGALHRRRAATGPTTFRSAFDAFFELKAPQLSNPKHAAQWLSTMDAYVFPRIGGRSIADIGPAEIIDLLKPIWNEKPETAKRVLQRMRAVFEAAIVRGDRLSASPTTGVAKVLGQRRLGPVRHHPAMPYRQVPEFVRRLCTLDGWPATRLAFELLILTAARSGEVRLAKHEEFDEVAKLWIVPPERMKARQAHVVPLCPRALAIIAEARRFYPMSEFLFPGTVDRQPLSDMTFTKVLRDAGFAGSATAHGFRSSFKDWCAEVAKVPDEVSEAALAHTIPGKVRAAYLRTKFLDERRKLMPLWADYVTAAIAEPAGVRKDR